MPVYPLRAIEEGKGRLVRRPNRYTSTPIPTQRDLRPLSDFGSGILAIPELGSTFNVVASSSSKEPLQEPKMNDHNAKKPSVLLMICEAIKLTGSVKKGASVQAIKKFLIGHYGCEDGTRLNGNIKKALIKGTEEGILHRPKSSSQQTGARGFFTVNKKNVKSENLEPKEKPEEKIISKPKKQIVNKTQQKSKKTEATKQNEPVSSKTATNSKKLTNSKNKSEKIVKASTSSAKPKEQPFVKTKVSKKSKKKAVNGKAVHQSPETKEIQNDSDKTLTDSPTNKVENRRKKLSSATSDSELTLVQQDLNVIRNRMDFSSDSEMNMSSTAKEVLGRTLKTTESSAKLKKAKRLSLKTSRISRKRADPRRSSQKKTRRIATRSNNQAMTSAPPNSPIENNIKTKARRGAAKIPTRDLSADSIVKPNRRKMLRRKSSV